MCEYCKDYTKKHKAMSNFKENKNVWLSIYEHYMEIVDERKEGNVISFKINYCPICGRKLN